MATNRIIIEVEADTREAQAAVNRLRGTFQGLESESGRIGGLNTGLANLANLATVGSIAVGGITAAANMAVGAIEGLAGAVGSVVSQAARLEQEQLALANTVRAVGGIALEEAQVTVDNLVSSMAEKAATLPGTVEDFVGAMTGVLDNLAGTFDVKTEEGKRKFEQGAEAIGTLGGMLVATTDMTEKHFSLFANKFLQGASESQVRTLKALQESPALLSAIEEFYQQNGIDWKNATEEQRIAALEFASTQLYPKEILDKYANSIQGQIDGLRSLLFDPREGIFGGILKQLGDGGGSVSDAAKEFVSALFAEGGLIHALGQVAQVLGFDSDSFLLSVRDIIEGLTGFINNLTQTITSLIDSLSPTQRAQLAKFASWVRGLTSGLSNLTSFNPAQTFNNLVTRLRDLLKPSSFTGFANIGIAFSQGMTWLRTKLVEVIQAVDWSQLGALTMDALLSGLEVLAGAIWDYFTGGGLTSTIAAIVSIVNAIVDFFLGAADALIARIVPSWDMGISNLVRSVRTTITRIGNAITRLVNSILEGLASVAERIPFGAGNLAANTIRAFQREEQQEPATPPQRSRDLAQVSREASQASQASAITQNNSISVSVNAANTSNPEQQGRRIARQIEREIGAGNLSLGIA